MPADRSTGAHDDIAQDFVAVIVPHTLARHHGPVSAANAITALSARDCSLVPVGNLAAHQFTGASAATPARPRPHAPDPDPSLGVQIAPFQCNLSRNLHFLATGP